jgi:NosR/NirI family transcriptional regulator, nitrous oxide reductase regulator
MGMALLAFGLCDQPRAADGPPPVRFAHAVFAEIDTVGEYEGEPPAATAYAAGRPAGYVFSTHAVVGSIGYSGRPFDILVGLDLEGTIAGAQLIAHSEPVMVTGIAEAELERFIASFAGLHVGAAASTFRPGRDEAGPDAVSGATVSSVMFGDAILRAARAVAVSRGVIAADPGEDSAFDPDRYEPRNWQSLLRDGLIGRLHLRNRDIDRAIAERAMAPLGDAVRRDPVETFVDLYATLASPAWTGRNLLGDRTYFKLRQELEPGAHAILIMASGLYSVKGTAHIRTGVFDRLQVVQGQNTIRLTAQAHRRIDALAPEDAPGFREIGWFALPQDSGFDPRRPWSLRLLVERRVEGGSIYLEFTLPVGRPGRLIGAAEPASGQAQGWLARLRVAAGEPDGPHVITRGLWQELWGEHTGAIAMLGLLLGILTLALAFQDWLVRRPRLYDGFRLVFLAVTLGWLGWYAGAQLSVIHVLTFLHALLTGFNWERFLMEPLIFILWSYVAIALLYWGRGVFCGWLCPFGALQELLNRAARAVRIPQLQLPFALTERLWTVKYAVFLALLALSLHAMTAATLLAEVEPFKTAITLSFNRSWPYVAYALALLGIGLFVQRFYCRYLCPLGAALAIPARLSLFRWLKRRPQCGRECRICAVHCPVQAIHPSGEINPNECIYCLGCQMNYFDDTVCPPLIHRRERRPAPAARRSAAVSPDIEPKAAEGGPG